MIARELLVKLGFDIDENKLKNFSQNVENLKSNINGIKSKFALDVDQSGVQNVSKKIAIVKANMDAIKDKFTLNVDQEKLGHLDKTVQHVKSNIDAVKSGFALEVDDNDLDKVSLKIKQVNQEMLDLEGKINKHKNPVIDENELKSYKRDNSGLGRGHSELIERWNAKEKRQLDNEFQKNQKKHAQLKMLNKQLVNTQKNLKAASRDAKRFEDSATRSFKLAAGAARKTNWVFSRYFKRAALIGGGSFLFSMHKTLKDIKDFQEAGHRGTNSMFSTDQLNAATQFNVSLRQTKRSLTELRNGFVISLMPAFKDLLNDLNRWLITNKKMIQSELKKFIESLGSVFNTLASAVSTVFSVLDPLVNLIGGWGAVLSGFIGLGILSWVVRLGVFLRRAAAAVIFFSGAVRILTVSLMTNPLCLLFMAIAAAIALIADEFIVTARGGDSLINSFGGIKQVIDNCVSAIKTAIDWLVKLNQTMFDFTIGGGYKDAFKGLVGEAKKASSKISDSFGDALGANLVPKSRLKQLKSGGRNSRQIGSPEDFGGLNIRVVDRLGESAFNSNARRSNASNRPSNITHNINNNNKITNTINVPSGSTEVQQKAIMEQVEYQIQEALGIQNDKMTLDIGAV
jgi:hypothetical protein